MGRLAGFRYREISRRLKAVGFRFDRQAAGSHEIWFNSNDEPLHYGSESLRRPAGRDPACGRSVESVESRVHSGSVLELGYPGSCRFLCLGIPAEDATGEALHKDVG